MLDISISVEVGKYIRDMFLSDKQYSSDKFSARKGHLECLSYYVKMLAVVLSLGGRYSAK